MFEPEIRQFVENLDVLKAFVDSIAPVLADRDKAILQGKADAFIPLAIAMKRLLPPDSGTPEAPTAPTEEELRSRFKGEIKIEPQGAGVSISLSGDDARRFHAALAEFARSFRQTHLLYQSALISLVSFVEWFLSQLLTKYFQRYPEAAGVTEKIFSLEDLQRFGSIDDAKKALIAGKVEDTLRGSFEDWLKFLRGRGLSMGYLTTEIDEVSEVFQRRNVFVHAGGRVGPIYLAKVKAKYRKQLKLGEQIFIEPEYLDTAIERFELNFVLLAAELWKKLEPATDERARVLTQIAFDKLTKEKWRIAEGLSYFTMDDKQAQEQLRVVGQLNFWQAVKWQGRYEEVRTQVEEADFSAKELRFQLALLALTDDVEAVCRLLPRVIETKSLELSELDTWPIFRSVRADDRYKETRSKLGPEPRPPTPSEPPERPDPTKDREGAGGTP